MSENTSAKGHLWIWLSIAAMLLPVLGYFVVHALLASESDRMWDATLAHLHAQGETLDIKAVAPKPVPDEDNFFAAEPLKDLALIVDGDDKKREPGARRARIKRLSLRPPFHSSRGKIPEGSGRDHGVPWEAEKWAEYYRLSGWLPMPVKSDRPGADILKALSEGDTLYAELISAAGRPHTLITPPLVQRWSSSDVDGLTDLAYLNSAMELAWLLCLRAQAKVADGKAASACGDVRAALRLAEGSGNEPLLTGWLISCTVSHRACESSWSILQSRQTGAAELAALETDLARLDYQKIGAQALRGEMCFHADLGIEAWRKDPSAYEVLVQGSSMSDPLEATEAYLQLGCWHINPQAVAKGNLATFCRYVADYPLLPLGRHGLEGALYNLERWRSIHGPGNPGEGVMFTMANDSMNAYPVVQSAIRAQARLHQCRLACALERYYLVHGHYPEKLATLVPGFMEKVLIDPADNHPMRYARTPAGRYKLWSLGLDGDDDGGLVIPRTDEDPSTPELGDRDYPGDWVWAYERLVPEPEE